MRILNLRGGFATSSSSAHSLIFMKNVEDFDCSEGEFNFQNFIAASPKVKALYLTAILNNSLQHLIPDIECMEAIAKKLVDASVRITNDDGGYATPNIDHQSIYMVPYSFNRKFINVEFFKEFTDFIMQDELVILGGDDQGDPKDIHPLRKQFDSDFILPVPQEARPAQWVCRKDPKYGFWTLFDTIYGDKVRLTFDSTAN